MVDPSLDAPGIHPPATRPLTAQKERYRTLTRRALAELAHGGYDARVAHPPPPPAEVYLDDDAWEFVLPECPHCGQTHTHGAGDRGEDPREYLGHRVAHCDPSRVRDAWALGYCLVLPVEMSA